MIIKLFAIYDKKALHYGNLFPAPTLGAGERAFSDAIANTESQYNAHPDDYALYHLADYDDSSGSIDPRLVPELVAEGIALVK